MVEKEIEVFLPQIYSQINIRRSVEQFERKMIFSKNWLGEKAVGVDPPIQKLSTPFFYLLPAKIE